MPNTVEIEVPEGQQIDKITFKKIDNRPMSWDEYFLRRANNPLFHNENSRTQRVSSSLYAMYKLRLLRNAWRNGWEPDYSEDEREYKYRILLMDGILRCEISCSAGFLLSFETKEDAELFLETFRDIIKTAKPYLGG